MDDNQRLLALFPAPYRLPGPYHQVPEGHDHGSARSMRTRLMARLDREFAQPCSGSSHQAIGGYPDVHVTTPTTGAGGSLLPAGAGCAPIDPVPWETRLSEAL